MIAAQLRQQDEVKARRVIKQRYELQAQLGKGNFGKVYLAIDNHDIGRKVAVKVVDTRTFRSKDQQQHANNEKAICEKLSQTLEHKNIVKVYDVFLEYDKIYVVMEYVEGGELFEEIKRRRRLAEPVARRYFREIVEAVAFIHENKIVHRDLKPENVLLDKQQSIRLCDFGFGKFCERHKTLETYCGSPFYAAPEMVTATPYLGPPVDMWSCGVILYAMLAGSLPFQGEDMQHLFRRIDEAKFELPPNISQEAADLIKRLLCRIPSARITARDCLAHPWLAEPAIEPSPSPSLCSAKTTVSAGARVGGKQQQAATKTNSSNKATSSSSSSSSPSSSSSSPSSSASCSLSVPKKSRASRLLTRMFAKKAQVAPATTTSSPSSPSQSPKKRNKIKAVESKMANRVKGFLKSAFQRRIA